MYGNVLSWPGCLFSTSLLLVIIFDLQESFAQSILATSSSSFLYLLIPISYPYPIYFISSLSSASIHHPSSGSCVSATFPKSVTLPQPERDNFRRLVDSFKLSTTNETTLTTTTTTAITYCPFMLESSESQRPPPLHYSPFAGEHDRSSTRDSTSTTPLGFGVRSSSLLSHNRPDREKVYLDPFWNSRNSVGSRPSYFDPHFPPSSHFQEDHDFPLFPSSPKMNGLATPIDIATRQTSVSPPGQQASNLTSALQKANNGERTGSVSHASSVGLSVFKAPPPRKDSVSTAAAQWGNGTKPISVSGSNRDKPRRESLAGSLVGGMSWGGVSVGSWIRDE